MFGYLRDFPNEREKGGYITLNFIQTIDDETVFYPRQLIVQNGPKGLLQLDPGPRFLEIFEEGKSISYEQELSQEQPLLVGVVPGKAVFAAGPLVSAAVARSLLARNSMTQRLGENLSPKLVGVFSSGDRAG